MFKSEVVSSSQSPHGTPLRDDYRIRKFLELQSDYIQSLTVINNFERVFNENLFDK